MNSKTKKITTFVVSTVAVIATVVILLIGASAHSTGETVEITNFVVTTTETMTTQTTTETTITVKTTPETTAVITTKQTATFIIETQKPTTEAVLITTEPVATTTTTVVPVIIEEYVIYKPATHYIHMNTCRWFNSECYRIKNTEGIEARKCSECNPDMEIITEYIVKTPTNTTNPISYEDLTDWDITLLRRIVSSEYGSDWVSTEEKAKIVASVMNMVESDDSYYPDDILGVLNKTCTPWGFNPYKNYYMSDSIIAAVDYYFANKDTVFANWRCTSWWGDGKTNHFYYYQNGVRIYQ